MSTKNEWLDIIVKQNPTLHMDKRVEHHSERTYKKKQKVLSWLEKINEINKKVSNKKNKNLEQTYKNMYYKYYIIKGHNIPESYYIKEQKIARDRGYEDIEINSEFKHKLATKVMKDQKESLDKWIEYFLYNEEIKKHPIWEQYWIFQGLQKLGKYDRKNYKFNKRDKTTVYPFPIVEPTAVIMTLDLMNQYLENKLPKQYKKIVSTCNFKQIYELSLKKILEQNNQKKDTSGEWIKYNQGSDYHKLKDSLQGYYTGWCTAAGDSIAKDQLEKGDFYVYYSKNSNGENKIPRIAIRMEGSDEIAEIRGIEENQNIETIMIPILDKKLQEFPDKDIYYKKERDMLLLTKIYNKVSHKQELTIEELIFLYEINDYIESFGFEEDPRIKEIKSKRDILNDLRIIFKNIKNIPKDLNLSELKVLKDIEFPEIIEGDLNLKNVETIINVVFPEEVYNVDLTNLKEVFQLTLSPTFDGAIITNYDWNKHNNKHK